MSLEVAVKKVASIVHEKYGGQRNQMPKAVSPWCVPEQVYM